MSNVKDFKSLKNLVAPGSDIPIIGQPIPKAQIRDALGRVLEKGDFIILQTPNAQPFRVQAIEKMESEPGQPPMMRIQLTSTTFFLSFMDVSNQEFMRVMTNEEVVARQASGQISQSADRPDAKPVAPPTDIPPQTLGDA